MELSTKLCTTSWIGSVHLSLHPCILVSWIVFCSLQKVRSDVFIESLVQPCLCQGEFSKLCECLLSTDPSLEKWNSHLMACCNFLNKTSKMNTLYSVQLFMKVSDKLLITSVPGWFWNLEDISIFLTFDPVLFHRTSFELAWCAPTTSSHQEPLPTWISMLGSTICQRVVSTLSLIQMSVSGGKFPTQNGPIGRAHQKSEFGSQWSLQILPSMYVFH